MASSFKKSLEAMAVSEQKTDTAIAVYSDDISSETFVRSSGYTWYDSYYDEDYSTVDSLKNVKVNANQVNITQEENSQVIPFLLNRYYDGVDLTTMNFQIYFVNANNDTGISIPINFEYSESHIRFYWLIDNVATVAKGRLSFEIQATGVNEHGLNYMWKTRPNTGDLNVLEALQGNGIVQPSDDWYTSFVRTMNEKIAEATKQADAAKASADQAQSLINDVNDRITNVEDEITNKVIESMTSTLSNYYTKEEVDQIIANLDFSEVLNEVQKKIDAIDGLANLGVTYDSATSTLTFKNGDKLITECVLTANPTAEWTSAFKASIKNDISTVTNPLSEDIVLLKSDVQRVETNLSDLQKNLESNYDTSAATDKKLESKADSSEISGMTQRISAVESTANANKTNVQAMSSKLGEIEDKIKDISTEPGATYYATYDSEQQFTLWEVIDDVETPKSSFKIAGGGSGPSTTTTIKIDRITASPYVVIKNDKAVIKYSFSSVDSSGDDTGEGTATWKVGNSIVATSIALQGENSFDLTDYITVGTQKITLSITDSAGTVSVKTWTVQVVDVRLESSFNDQFTYPIGTVSFDYVPYGAVEKVIHLKLDGQELDQITTTSSGLPMSYSIPTQTHGSHLLEAYITASINGVAIETNHIFKDILWYDPDSDVPVIGCVYQNITVKQYDSINISYVVYDPKTENPKVTLAVDDKVVSTLTLDSPSQVWQYKSDSIGNHKVTITCRDTVKEINLVVEKLDIDIEPVTANLAFDFNPVGRSNNDENRLWTDGAVSMSVSDNFDWTNGGYQIDENGDQYFCVKAGTTAEIGYNLFADDARKNGKEFKIIFKTMNVRKSNASFLSCQSGSSPIGLKMNVHEAYINSSVKSLYAPYSEEDIIEFEFNINKDTDIPIVMTYEDGTPYRPMVYTSDHTFTQSSPVPITIGSSDCDVWIYRMKAYSGSLTSRAVLTNFIADARTATEMVTRYNQNQIYNENGMLTPESAAENCPDMRIIKIEAPHFTNDKKDFVKNTSMECVYKNGDPILDNWKFTNGYHAGQGTTSNEYGAAGRNIDVICCFDGEHQVNSKITLDPTYKTELVLGDGTKYTDGTGKITLTRNSIPTSWLNFKVNIASSDMANNAQQQKRYNTYLPYQTPATRRDPRVKNDMEFVNCIIFIKESDPDISTHREFQDTDWHFYALGNMGDSKKTDVSRAYDPDDMKEFCIEISDNTLANSTFQTGVSNSDGSMKYPISKAEWVSGNTAYDALYNNWDGSFEFRYDCCGDSKDGTAISTDEEKEKIRTANRQIWRDFYEFVITSSNAEFKEKISNWCIVDSLTYFYLFTLRYTMIDNRAKNTFWHWAKHYISQEEAATLGDKAAYYTIDDAAAGIKNGYRFDLWDYDNDTCLGINNSGELTMTYGKEDTDYRTDGDPSSGYIFNAAESVIWCRIRDLMRTQLQTMYASRESQGCWSAESLINQYDKAQAEWPEELWRLDYERKYERTYRAGNTRFLEEMMNGKKKYQRRQFERDQEMYIATKFYGATATSNQIMFRCNTPKTAVVKPDYTLHLTPFSDMYLSVMFGNSSPTQIRAKAGQQYDITCPYETMDDTAVLVYGASRIQSMGDISTCYIHDNDFSKATKLQELIIGNKTAGYSNTFLTNLGIGNNSLLQKLDIQNTPNLAQSLNLSGCSNLEELYAEGSGLTGITFANGGKIRIAHIPAVTSFIGKNLSYITDMQLAGFENLHTLVIENTPKINSYEYVISSPELTNVRLIGIDWGVDEDIKDSSILDRLLTLAGIDNNGYNADLAVLAGAFYTPVMKQKLLQNYNTAWPDLSITYDTLVQQFTVKFVNDDGTVLDVQYVDKGGSAVDPITRKDNPIAIPTKESSQSTDFTFKGWNAGLTGVFSDRTIKATYSESVRTYTVKYIEHGKILEEKTAEYGSSVEYTGDIPTYTDEESAYVFYLFKGWDKSGYVNGDKEINAVYDRFEYTDGCFDNLDIAEMTPVQIYALIKVNKEQEVVELKDSIKFSMGADYSYEDIQEKVLIDKETIFTGSNYVDTGIKLLETDSSWTLAVDYKFGDGNTTGAVLMQCYQGDGSNGFKLWHSGQPRITWGTSSTYVATSSKRDMLIIRHTKGDNKLYVYKGNLPAIEIDYATLSATRSVAAASTLVFGCARADDGAYENHAKGTIYWSKLWYTDLGDTACRSLASWTHESITWEMAGFKRYYLSDGSGQRSSMTFLASHLLANSMPLNSSTANTGGWATTTLNTFLNQRFYSAIPVEWKQLIKQVKISSSIGDMSSEISTSNCYVAIPSVAELDGSMNFEPYSYEGSVISYITSDATRLRKYDGGAANGYWTRSPNVSYQNYVWIVENTGSLNGFQYALYDQGVLIMLNI